MKNLTPCNLPRRHFVLGAAAIAAAGAAPHAFGRAAGGRTPADVIVVSAGLAGLAAALDTSMHDFLRSRGLTDAMIQLSYDTNASYGTSAYEVSALQLFFIEAWGRVQRQIQPQALYKAKGGNERIPEAMAAGLAAEVRTGVAVTAVESTDAGVTVPCSDGSRLAARAVVLARPSPCCGNWR